VAAVESTFAETESPWPPAYLDPSRHRGWHSLYACGFDAGKKVKGRKRHIVTDTDGSLLAVQVHAANIQDVHGAVPLLKYVGMLFPKLRHIFADRVYRGKQLPAAIAEFGKWVIEIVTRSQSVGTFKAEPRLNGRLLGSTDADGSPRISRKQSRAPRRGSSLPAFVYFLGVSQGPENMGINNESDSEVVLTKNGQGAIG
jgi:transposase